LSILSYIHKDYEKPAKLFINDSSKSDSILSEEGRTQGDVAAMAFYSLGIRPLTSRLIDAIDSNSCKQMWYADDSNAIGKLLQVRKCWDILCYIGPSYGYYPKSSMYFCQRLQNGQGGQGNIQKHRNPINF
jgi:hypothetical protein